MPPADHVIPPSAGLGDYSSAPCQDPQQLRDGDGFVPARPLPQETEAGIDRTAAMGSGGEGRAGPGLTESYDYHRHHHGPRRENVTVSEQHPNSPTLSDTPTHS